MPVRAIHADRILIVDDEPAAIATPKRALRCGASTDTRVDRLRALQSAACDDRLKPDDSDELLRCVGHQIAIHAKRQVFSSPQRVLTRTWTPCHSRAYVHE